MKLPPTGGGATLRCLLVAADSAKIDLYRPESPATPDYLRAVRLAIEGCNIELIIARKLVQPVKTPQTVADELASPAVVVAEVSGGDPVAPFYLGFAKSLGKTIITLCAHGGARVDPVTRLSDFHFDYESTAYGIDELANKLKGVFQAVLRAEELDHSVLARESDGSQSIDWGRVARVDHENLCYEMLLRKDFSDLQWLTGTSAIDLISLRSREQGRKEIFLVSIGSGLPDEMAVQLWIEDYKGIFPQVQSWAREISAETPGRKPVINALFIWSPQDTVFKVGDECWFELNKNIKLISKNLSIAVAGGIWDREYLDTAVRQHPMIVRKYFADDLRERAERHKTTEDLYREAATLGSKSR